MLYASKRPCRFQFTEAAVPTAFSYGVSPRRHQREATVVGGTTMPTPPPQPRRSYAAHVVHTIFFTTLSRMECLLSSHAMIRAMARP